MLVAGRSNSGWSNAAHRVMLVATFDAESCETVTAIACFRTFVAGERAEVYKP